MYIDCSNQTIIHKACECENLGLVKYLIELNEIDFTPKEEYSDTILHSACLSGNY